MGNKIATARTHGSIASLPKYHKRIAIPEEEIWTIFL
jgi:hypothetical protein